MPRFKLSIFCALNLLALAVVQATEPTFRGEEIETKLGIGYAVSLVDMNADKKLDILVVDTDRVIWYENPSWKMHLVIQGKTKKDNVCIAPHDIDGDGKLDLALGADWRPSDTVGSGTLQWLSPPKAAGDQWDLHPIGVEPTIHRIRWADLERTGKPQLIVAPLFGRGSKAPHFQQRATRILSYTVPADPRGEWKPEVISEELHVIHNIWPTDFDDDGKLDLLAVSFEGVTLLKRDDAGKWSSKRIGAGNQETTPNRGASEIKVGLFNKDAKTKYIATIEPWHGFQVVVYTEPNGKSADGLWTRTVLDDELKWGHAVWCANLDDDEEEELIIGVRDNKNDTVRSGLRIYDPRVSEGKDGKSGKTVEWKRTLIDPGGVAIEDLAAGDLDGDGKIDIVAVGRATKNIKIYWNGKK